MRFLIACACLLVAISFVVGGQAVVVAEHKGVPHPQPVVETFQGCPPEGQGGDPKLNFLKNRIDESAQYEDWTIVQLLALPSPQGVGRRNRDRWPPEAAQIISRYEGAPVRTVGFLIRQKKQGKESTNCGSTADADHHFWLTADRGQPQAQSVVAEPSPRTKAKHPGWRTLLAGWDKPYANGEEPRLRVSGWLMFDQEHPEQLGQHRGTLWEIHPVTKLEIWNGGQWIDLDQTQ